MRVVIRGQEWLVTKVEQYSFGYEDQRQNLKFGDTARKRFALTCVGIDPLVRDYQAMFLTDVEPDIEPVDPANTRFILDTSPSARDSHLYIESMLRATVPTDDQIHVAEHAAMDKLPYQFDPAKQALSQPRQRILIADAVGLGKTLEAGILMSELIRRHKGARILVVTSKNMMAQFQREMWEHFTIPLTNLDSSRIQRIRTEIPANANPFNYFDKVIVSVDTLKRDIEYGSALDDSYWDIIVIDEAQNVADRANGKQKAQRARLANRLARRSDALIMLSATPHDGSARSFASLMNMLDPTTLPNPNEYSPDNIRQLYIRRFKKDISSDVSGSFPAPHIVEEDVHATSEEEAAFDYLTQMTMRAETSDSSRRSMLFRTTLEKSLFSSPAACIMTIRERIKRLRDRKTTDAQKQADIAHDIMQLEELQELVQRITPEYFARYQRLLWLLQSPSYHWTRERNDRIVIFTERIETKKFLAEHLRNDLGLKEREIVTMDGSMSDLEQQATVADFNDPKKPIRILVASDVASEGLNLHHLAHRMIHFDTPWSLMVFQQRNGRIDRYGQHETPDIRFMRIGSENPKIKGDERILQVLIDKEKQARDNIGDPSMLMKVYDVNDETMITAQAMEEGESGEQFAARLDSNVQEMQIDVEAEGDDFFDPLAALEQFDDMDEHVDDRQGQRAGADVGGSSPYARIDERAVRLMDDLQFVDQALHSQKITRHAGIDRIQDLDQATGFRVEFAKDSQLYKWLVRRTPNAEVLHGHTASWSTDVDYVRAQSNGLMAQLSDERWSNTQFLWALSPISDWVEMKASTVLYGRNEAPIIGIQNGRLAMEDTIILLTASIANNRAIPVINEWVGVRYRGGSFAELMTIEDVWKVTGYRGEYHASAGKELYINKVSDDSLSDGQRRRTHELLPDAIQRIGEQIRSDEQRYKKDAERHVDAQIDRIIRWRDDRKLIDAHSERESDQIFNEYEQWVHDSYETTGEPVIRVAAAFTGARR
ncbi:SNF2- related helicase [Bifidobacterium pseudolongum subsp. globosum]|uniref:SNF2-related helicase n=2 Tax=Bifidobacterium pseudolongum TaxID=1694 RepID=A0A4Q5A1T4_9BIFI|nr:SNF2- related helicase [Bifidobacterium pseudolongum subsp. globosum]